MSQPRRKPAAMTVDAARAAVAVVEHDLASAVEERNRVLLTDVMRRWRRSTPGSRC
jgi:hypothetical protein